MVVEEDARALSIVEKYILMLLYAAKGKIRGKLWLQKEMFELSKSFKELAEELDFNAYSYGPYSEALDEYLDMLVNSGLVEIEDTGKAQVLKLSDRGFELAKNIWSKEGDEKEIVKEVSDFLEGLEKDELLLYIYVTSPPEMSEKSDIKEEILRRRVDTALKMLEKGKISLSLAAKISGLTVNELIEKAIKRKIKLFDIKDDIGSLIGQQQP